MKRNLLFIFFALIFASNTFAQNPPLWGMTIVGGENDAGTIFKINGDGTGFTTVFSFVDSLGKRPSGSFLVAKNRKLYGTTGMGGTYNKGVLFSFDTINNKYVKLVDFDGINGQNPFSSLIQLNNGKLYGVTTWGGANINYGVIFCFDPASNIYTKLYDFNSTDGSNPYGGLVKGSNGKLYGTTIWGGVNNCGVIYSFDITNNSYSKLFDLEAATGLNPWANLIQASNGKMYGTTYAGGAFNAGVIFSFDINNNLYSDLFDFNGLNGQIPRSNLVEGHGGNLYGVTSAGAANGSGNLFSINTNNNNFTVLHDFINSDGNYAFGSPIRASDGNLYGLTGNGGSDGKGVIYKYDIANDTLTRLFDFIGPNGANPIGGLTEILATDSQEPTVDGSLSIYPNPVSDEIVISTYIKKEDQNAEFKIFNLLGQIVLSEVEESPIGSYSKVIDIRSLSNEIYLLQINIDGERIVKKFMKE